MGTFPEGEKGCGKAAVEKKEEWLKGKKGQKCRVKRERGDE